MKSHEKQKFADRVEEILEAAGFLKFSQRTRGFSIINPRQDQLFLGFLQKFSGHDTFEGGIVVAPLGFGNLDSAFLQAITAANSYGLALAKAGFNSSEILVKPEELISRGIYLFVPYQ